MKILNLIFELLISSQNATNISNQNAMQIVGLKQRNAAADNRTALKARIASTFKGYNTHKNIISPIKDIRQTNSLSTLLRRNNQQNIEAYLIAEKKRKRELLSRRRKLPPVIRHLNL